MLWCYKNKAGYAAQIIRNYGAARARSRKGAEANPGRKSEKLVTPPFRRIKSGDYRIIYALLEEESKVVVVVVRYRREAYADLSNLPAILAKTLKDN